MSLESILLLLIIVTIAILFCLLGIIHNKVITLEKHSQEQRESDSKNFERIWETLNDVDDQIRLLYSDLGCFVEKDHIYNMLCIKWSRRGKIYQIENFNKIIEQNNTLIKLKLLLDHLKLEYVPKTDEKVPARLVKKNSRRKQ